MSITTVVFDFSNVFLFPVDENYKGKQSDLHRQLMKNGPYSVFEHFRFDHELLKLVATLKGKVKLYLFTNGILHEVPEIRKELDSVFDHLYTTKDVGYKKDSPKAFTKLAEILQVTPEEILFFDDTLENIEAARGAGVTAHQYLSVDALRATLGTYGIL